MRLSTGKFRNETCNPIELSGNFIGGFLQLAHDTFASNTPVRVLLHEHHYSAVLYNILHPPSFKPTNMSFASLHLDYTDIYIANT